MQSNQTKPSGQKQAEPRRRTTYSVLIGIILLTLPCYLIGFGLLFITQPAGNDPTPTRPASTATAALLPSATLGAVLPTDVNIPTRTVAPLPTRTSVPSSTPSNTPSPTLSSTSTQTHTPTSSPTLASSPTPTAPPQTEATQTPAPTQTPSAQSPTQIPPTATRAP